MTANRIFAAQPQFKTCQDKAGGVGSASESTYSLTTHHAQKVGAYPLRAGQAMLPLICARSKRQACNKTCVCQSMAILTLPSIASCPCFATMAPSVVFSSEFVCRGV